MLTELEGAVLSEIHLRGHDTAFQVRRAFAVSASLEWKGSAGAVYAAVKRLQHRDLIEAAAESDGRATRRLSLTQAGIEALTDWACDAVRATSVGIDPFRLRAGIWEALDRNKRLRTLEEVSASLEEDIVRLRDSIPSLDLVEQVRVDLSLRAQMMRREWIDQSRLHLDSEREEASER